MKDPAYLLRLFLLLATGVAAVGWMFSRPAFPQDVAYHAFVDQRPFLGIPHGLNVISNLPFLIVGALGLRFLRREPATASVTPVERWPYGVLFVGVGLTGFGSAYYHLDPTNARLLWDRLPMTLAFMALFAAVIGERLGPRIGAGLLGPLLALGLASVLYWHETELRGAGDLRFYYLVQGYPMLAIPLLVLLFPAPYSRSADLFVALGLYALAKLVEHRDAEIYDFGKVVSGHTLKHLLAALAAYVLLHMLQVRKRRE